MLLTFIYLLIAFVGIILYINKKYSHFIFVLFFILLSGYYFVPTPIVSLDDIALIMSMGCAIYGYTKDKHFFSAKDDNIAKIIYVLWGYYTIIAIATVLLGREELIYSFRVWRLELYYLAYFIFRKIPISKTEKAFKAILFISIIGGIFYFLQFIGITGIINGNVEERIKEGGKFIRLTNIPYFTSLILYYLIYNKSKIKFRYILIVFFASMVILSQGRGLMISLVASIVIYQLFMGKISQILKIGLIFGVIAILFAPLIRYRYLSSGSQNMNSEGLLKEMRNSLSLTENFDNANINDINGTFTFRIFLFTERMNYLFQHPQYLLTGVGTVHEDSPLNRNRFHFIVGSNKIDKEGNLVQQPIVTNDIAFITRIFEYGIIYFFLYIYFMIMVFKRLYKERNISIMVLIAFLLFLKMAIQCLGSDSFSTFKNMAFILLVLAQTSPTVIKKTSNTK